MKTKKWNRVDLEKAVLDSFSIRQVIIQLGLKPAGGNYQQVSRAIVDCSIDISHFKGKGWNRGLTMDGVPRVLLSDILKVGSTFQSFKLKKRLIKVGLKEEKCELCGWSEVSVDGRIPLELHHINGISKDNRLENLKILCPNCHSLQASHRGRNIGKNI